MWRQRPCRFGRLRFRRRATRLASRIDLTGPASFRRTPTARRGRPGGDLPHVIEEILLVGERHAVHAVEALDLPLVESRRADRELILLELQTLEQPRVLVDVPAELPRLAFDADRNSVIDEGKDVELVNVFVREGHHRISQARNRNPPFAEEGEQLHEHVPFEPLAVEELHDLGRGLKGEPGRPLVFLIEVLGDERILVELAAEAREGGKLGLAAPGQRKLGGTEAPALGKPYLIADRLQGLVPVSKLHGHLVEEPGGVHRAVVHIEPDSASLEPFENRLEPPRIGERVRIVDVDVRERWLLGVGRCGLLPRSELRPQLAQLRPLGPIFFDQPVEQLHRVVDGTGFLAPEAAYRLPDMVVPDLSNVSAPATQNRNTAVFPRYRFAPATTDAATPSCRPNHPPLWNHSLRTPASVATLPHGATSGPHRVRRTL